MSNIPSEWEVIPLSEVIQTQKGKKPENLGPRDEVRTVPYITIAAFESKKVEVFAPEQDIPRCEPDDTLLVWDGARTGLCGRGVSGYVGSTITRVTSDLANPSYLYHFLNSHYSTLNTQTKGVGIPHINPVVLNALEFPLPPLAEQTRIVEKNEELLSDLDAGVAELKAAQKKLAQYRQSLLKSAVEGALTAEWRTKNKPKETGAQLLERILKERRVRWEEKQLARFKEQGKTPPKGWQDKYPEPVQPDTTNLPELPEGWFYSELEALIPPDKTGTKTGPFGSLLKKHEHKSSGIPVVGIENIDRMKFIPGSKIHITESKSRELSEYDLLAGDVVISRSGTVGEVCVIPDYLGIARFSTNIMRVRLNYQVILPDYFCLLLNGSPFVLQQIRKLCSGSTRDFLNTEILMSIIFLVPPINEQHKIILALYVSLQEVETQNNAILQSLTQAAAQRKNILKTAFSGQLVSQNPDDEPASVLLERIREERKTSIKTSKKTVTPRRKPSC
ncbi:MAG: restriction endonuclease subunit S [Deltaproteobacteria bacterium]|nr:restriction endonuclease subunit S [Deltaproteobacteria bacterium]